MGLIYYDHALLLAPLTRICLRTTAEKRMNSAITAEDTAQKEADVSRKAWVEVTARADQARKE